MTSIRTGILLLSALALGSVAHAAAPAGQPSSKPSLDGTQWSIKVTPDEAAMKRGEKVFDDTLMFDSGKVSMSECVKYGFTASDYTVTGKSDAWVFKTQQKSLKEGTTSWEGEVKGGRVTGSMIWTKLDGTILRYTFEGPKKS